MYNIIMNVLNVYNECTGIILIIIIINRLRPVFSKGAKLAAAYPEIFYQTLDKIAFKP